MVETQPPERFQRRTLTTFNAPQFRQMFEWILSNGDELRQYPTLREAVAHLVPNEKKRRRYELGVDIVVDFPSLGRRIEELKEVIVWQIGPHETDLEAEWKFLDPHLLTNRFQR